MAHNSDRHNSIVLQLQNTSIQNMGPYMDKNVSIIVNLLRSCMPIAKGHISVTIKASCVEQGSILPALLETRIL